MVSVALLLPFPPSSKSSFPTQRRTITKVVRVVPPAEDGEGDLGW